jgi:hypothetical protein
MEELRFLWHTNKKSLCQAIKKGAAEVLRGRREAKNHDRCRGGLGTDQRNRLA